MAEVTRQVDQHDLSPPVHLRADRGERAVGAAVVDQHDLVVELCPYRLDCRRDSRQQRRDVFGFVIQGDHDAEGGA